MINCRCWRENQLTHCQYIILRTNSVVYKAAFDRNFLPDTHQPLTCNSMSSKLPLSSLVNRPVLYLASLTHPAISRSHPAEADSVEPPPTVTADATNRRQPGNVRATKNVRTHSAQWRSHQPQAEAHTPIRQPGVAGARAVLQARAEQVRGRSERYALGSCV